MSIAISKLLVTNKYLKELYLDHCTIDSEGAKRIIAGLTKNDSLRVLNLKGVSIEKDIAEFCLVVLSMNQSLTKLELDWNSQNRTVFMQINKKLSLQKRLIQMTEFFMNDIVKLQDRGEKKTYVFFTYK